MAKSKEKIEESAEEEIAEIVGHELIRKKKEWVDKLTSGIDFDDRNLIAISTGSIKLDWALKLPFLEGSMVEIYAHNGVGKTTLALHVCANGMKMGKRAYYIDLEYKLREAQIQMIPGLDRTNFNVLYPDTGEEALDMIHEIALNDPGCIFVLDSVGGLLPAVEDSEGFERQGMGEIARLCQKLIRKLSGIIRKNKCLLIFLNHKTSTMKAYGEAETTHGGNAIRNRSAQRIELKALAAGQIKDSKTGDRIGQKVTATVVKNNVNRPFITVEFPIIYGKGIDENLDIFEFAKELGLFGTTKGWYTWNEKKFRESELLETLATDAAFKEEIKQHIKKLFE